MLRLLCARNTCVLLLILRCVTAHADARNDKPLVLFDGKLAADWTLYQSQGEIVTEGTKKAALLRAYAPAKGTWDSLCLQANRPANLDGRNWLKLRVNFASSAALPKHAIRRVQLRVVDTTGRAQEIPWDANHANYYLDGAPVKADKQAIVFDNDPATYQVLELDLTSGAGIPDTARIDRVTLHLTEQADMRVNELVFMRPPEEHKAKTRCAIETRESHNTHWPWVGSNHFRLLVKCQAYPTDNAHRAAWAEIDFEQLAKNGVFPSMEWNPDSLRVVEYDPASGKLVDSTPEHYVPAKAERWNLLPMEDKPGTRRRPTRISWLRRSAGPANAVYGIYFDVPGAGEQEYLPSPSFVGVGDALSHARKDSLTDLPGVLIPTDWNKDGVTDVISTIGTIPESGTYVFINEGSGKKPLFSRMRKIRDGLNGQFTIKDINGDGKVDLGILGGFYSNFNEKHFSDFERIPEPKEYEISRAIPESRLPQRWYYADWDGDGVTDILLGMDGWWEYGWCNAFNPKGEWTRGPLDGRVYWLRNRGTNEKYDLEFPVRLKDADGNWLWTYGYFSPLAEDFDGDGDLDIISGDFVRNYYFFENVGTRTAPKLAPAKPLPTTEGPYIGEIQVADPTVYDWDGDGDLDLFIRGEDGRSGYLENLLKDRGKFVFAPLVRFPVREEYLLAAQLVAQEFKDWDQDGQPDLVFGHSPGTLGWFHNTGTAGNWQFDNWKFFTHNDDKLRIMAGENGSIQGPAEAGWGYTVPTVIDWDMDGYLDILTNSIWGRIVWFRNPGKIGSEELDPWQRVEVEWSGTAPKPVWQWWNPQPKEWATQWRSKVLPIDYDKDGLMDLVALDNEGYLVLHSRYRQGNRVLLDSGKRIFMNEAGQPWQINPGRSNFSGRTKFELTDWDNDGDLDLIQSAKQSNVDYYENVGSHAAPRYVRRGRMADVCLTGHDCTPSALDYNGDGRMDLIIGAEDGHFYCYLHEYIENPAGLKALQIQP